MAPNILSINLLTRLNPYSPVCRSRKTGSPFKKTTCLYSLPTTKFSGSLWKTGLHALEFVELDKRGLGSTGGGLKKYAEGVGYAANNVSKYRNAATVYQAFIKANISFNEESIKANEYLLEKTNHLGEIHKAPGECWRVLVELLLSKGWTVADTAKKVKRANEFEIPLQWQMVFLPLAGLGIDPEKTAQKIRGGFTYIQRQRNKGVGGSRTRRVSVQPSHQQQGSDNHWNENLR